MSTGNYFNTTNRIHKGKPTFHGTTMKRRIQTQNNKLKNVLKIKPIDSNPTPTQDYVSRAKQYLALSNFREEDLTNREIMKELLEYVKEMEKKQPTIEEPEITDKMKYGRLLRNDEGEQDVLQKKNIMENIKLKSLENKKPIQYDGTIPKELINYMDKLSKEYERNSADFTVRLVNELENKYKYDEDKINDIVNVELKNHYGEKPSDLMLPESIKNKLYDVNYEGKIKDLEKIIFGKPKNKDKSQFEERGYYSETDIKNKMKDIPLPPRTIESMKSELGMEKERLKPGRKPNTPNKTPTKKQIEEEKNKLSMQVKINELKKELKKYKKDKGERSLLVTSEEEEEGEGIEYNKPKTRRVKDPRPHIKKIKAKHQKLLKLLNSDLKQIENMNKKSSELHASGLGAGFFSSLGNIFKNIIGKVVGIGKTIFSKPENIVKAVNVGKEVYDSGKQIYKDIKDKKNLGTIASDVLHTTGKVLTGIQKFKPEETVAEGIGAGKRKVGRPRKAGMITYKMHA